MTRYDWQVHAVLGSGMFVVGTVVGSFLNVVIYRLPLEMSVMWPDSRCPKCRTRIGTFENIPILSWLVLGGSCRYCKLPISARYPLVELLVGVLFAATYLLDTEYAYRATPYHASVYLATLYHCVFVATLVAISYIDFDYTIVLPSSTNFGIAWGLILGAVFPGIRPLPGFATTPLGGLWVGVLGVLIAAGLVTSIRILGGLAFKREAMGAGDIHILAVVGAVMGWQGAVITFFLSAFFGFLPAIYKLGRYFVKRMTGAQWDASDREIPLGPFLSMAAVTLLFAWPWVWPKRLDTYFDAVGWLFRSLLRQER